MQPVPVLPIDVTAIVGIIMGMLAVLIPVTGLTARFALKPIAEAIARMREAQSAGDAEALLERRMALLEQEIRQLSEMREDVARLVEEVEFQRKLLTPESESH